MTAVDAASDGALPVDPDTEPALSARVVLPLVFAGGCAGGWVRYEIVAAWSSAGGRFPWSTLAVNLAGAAVLGLVVVVASARRSTLLRALLGTGFCGALTTFSAVVVSAAELFAHGHPGLAVAYLLASFAGGLIAGAGGLTLGRALTATEPQPW